MSDKPQFEFPEAVRELAERNVEQARSAYNQFIDMARKVQETLSASQGAMTSGATEMRTQIAKFAEQNIQASFSFATELSRARDLKEYIEIQQRYLWLIACQLECCRAHHRSGAFTRENGDDSVDAIRVDSSYQLTS